MSKLVAIGLSKLSEIIHLRSAGETIAQTAEELGLAPWHVGYVSRFIKVCVSNDEYRFLREEMSRWGFGTVGEFVMDVFHRCYDKHYIPAAKRRRTREMKKAS